MRANFERRKICSSFMCWKTVSLRSSAAIVMRLSRFSASRVIFCDDVLQVLAATRA